MSETSPRPSVTTQPLTHELAEAYVDTLTALACQIPGVSYTTEDVLATQKGDRQLLNKWDHSLAVFEGDEMVGVVVGYERRSEGNEQYPADTLYISELAVSPDYQGKGVAKSLLEEFFRRNNQVGFKTLSGPLNYSVQTNSADWNQPVVDLYKSYGLKQRALKTYPNRVDVVLGAEVLDLRGLETI